VTVEPKVLDEAKVEAMRGRLRLNVGSGSLAVDGYVNVDARAIDGVDVVADVADLPFDDGSVEEVRSSHVLEHFPEEELRRRVLPH
jgi:predicted SAM-dependent methyltransferase